MMRLHIVPSLASDAGFAREFMDDMNLLELQSVSQMHNRLLTPEIHVRPFAKSLET